MKTKDAPKEAVTDTTKTTEAPEPDAPAAAPPSPPPGWEYRTVQVKPYMHEGDVEARDAEYNALGRVGWEMVAFPGAAYVVFKRRLV